MINQSSRISISVAVARLASGCAIDNPAGNSVIVVSSVGSAAMLSLRVNALLAMANKNRPLVLNWLHVTVLPDTGKDGDGSITDK